MLTPRQVRHRRTAAVWLAVFSVLAWVPDGFSRFTFAKLLLVALACLVGSTVPALGRLPRRFVLLLGLAALVLAVAALTGDAPWAGLVGRWPRYEGLPVLAVYAGAAWVGAHVVPPRGEDLDVVVRPMTALAIVLAAASLLDVLGVSPLGASVGGRSGSLLGNATDQGMVAVMALAVLAEPALRGRTLPLLTGVAGAVLTLAVSGSRAALLAGLLVAVVVLVRARRSALRPALALVGLLVVGIAAVPTSRDRLLSGSTVRGRWEQWGSTLSLVRDHPALGVGPNGYLDAFGRYESVAFVRFSGGERLVDSPHSGVLQALVAGGLPLLLVAGALTAWVLVTGWRRVAERPALFGVLAAVAAYGVCLLPNFTAAGATPLAAFLVGVLVAEPAVAASRWSARAVTAASSVAVLLLAAACLGEIDVQRGVSAAAEGEVADSVDAFGSARGWRPWDVDVDVIAAQALAGAASDGSPEAAVEGEAAARRAVSRVPDSYQARVALGVTLIAQDRLDDALPVLDASVAGAPHRPTAYVQRGLVHFGLGDLPAARADLTRAVELYPRDRRPLQILRAMEARVGG